MNIDTWVYHGSTTKKKKSIPILHTRTKKDKIIFQDISFHASQFKWIALAYTYSPKIFTVKNKKLNYNIGVNLNINLREIEVYGINSLKHSLNALYEDGGYIHSFSNKDFFHTKGLGNLEVITTKKLKPLTIEFINNPVLELKKLGCTFKFIDISKC